MTFSRDLVAGGVILALTAFLWHITTTFDSDPLGMAQGMPATHMPRLVLGVIAVLTVIMMLQSFMNGGGETIDSLPPWQMMATTAFLAVAALMFTTLGVPIVFFCVCLVLPMLWGKRQFGVIAIFALCVPCAIYFIFKIILGLRLPMGPLAALGL